MSRSSLPLSETDSDRTLLPGRSFMTTLRLYLELAKPGVTRLVLLMTALGALAAPGATEWRLLAWAVLGTGLVVAGANALNMFMERESDARMTRTSRRPLPEGRMSADEALLFGLVVSVLGLMILAQFASPLALGLALFSLVSYVLVYTPLKRVSPVALYVGAVPGALPPAIGYAALTGTMDAVGWSLFLILLVWQLPHFLAITLFRAAEYERAGLRVLPVVKGRRHTVLMIVALSLLFLVVSVLPSLLGVVSAGAGVAALICGMLFTAYAAFSLPQGGDLAARRLFFASMPHLVIVMGSFVVSLTA